MNEQRLRLGAYITVLILGGGIIAYVIFKHALVAILPFLVAWAIAFAVRPAAAAISKRTRISARIWRGILAALISLASIGALCLLGWLIVAELWRLLSGLGNGEPLREIVDSIATLGPFGELFEAFGDRLADIFYEILVSAASAVGGALTGLIGAVPKVFLFIIIAVIASIYFAIDLDRINSALKAILPERATAWLSDLRRAFFEVGLKYIRSYAFLMLLTFAVMLVGLMILKRPYALLLSFIVALLDVLPVLGVGTVLIPWGIYELALGDTRLGIGLLVLFGVYELIRQLAEPRIMGRQLGVHPILTLVLVYISYTVFGIGGILIVPVLVVILNAVLGKNNSAEVKKSSVSEHNGA